jgi:hypothetical protein
MPLSNSPALSGLPLPSLEEEQEEEQEEGKKEGEKKAKAKQPKLPPLQRFRQKASEVALARMAISYLGPNGENDPNAGMFAYLVWS